MQRSWGIYLNFPKNAIHSGLSSSLPGTEENNSFNHRKINLAKCSKDLRNVLGSRCHSIVCQEMQNFPSNAGSGSGYGSIELALQKKILVWVVLRYDSLGKWK